MIRCDPRDGKYMAMDLFYEGDFTFKEVRSCVQDHMTRMRDGNDPYLQRIDWATSTKVTFDPRSPVSVAGWTDDALGRQVRACTMVANTTAIAQLFARVKTTAQLIDGLEWEDQQAELAEAIESIDGVCQDYLELGMEYDNFEDLDDYPDDSFTQRIDYNK